jgi:hypothetical protein
MAAIDKIYGTFNEYFIFKNWMHINAPENLRYFYDIPTNTKDLVAISNFPTRVDEWLWDNCPLKFVQTVLREQYDVKPSWIKIELDITRNEIQHLYDYVDELQNMCEHRDSERLSEMIDSRVDACICNVCGKHWKEVN